MFNEQFKPNQIQSYDYIIGTSYSLNASHTEVLLETKLSLPPPQKKKKKKKKKRLISKRPFSLINVASFLNLHVL